MRVKRNLQTKTSIHGWEIHDRYNPVGATGSRAVECHLVEAVKCKWGRRSPGKIPNG
jgi:hypothetical protein